MKINWKVRLKNEQFWISIALVIGTQIASYYNITGAELTTWLSLWNLFTDVASNPFILGSIGVAVYATIVDYTTKGVKDSSNALTYDKPKGDE